MESKDGGNVIVFKGKIKSIEEHSSDQAPSTGPRESSIPSREPQSSRGGSLRGEDIVDISEKRREVISEDRRQAKRTILTEFIAVHAVVPGFGLLKVSLFDINEHGVSFEIDYKYGQFQSGDDIELRIYLNHKTYFKVAARVAHVTLHSDTGVYRHGCHFIEDSVNSEALHHFIKFLETVTASLRRDTGDVMISNINS